MKSAHFLGGEDRSRSTRLKLLRYAHALCLPHVFHTLCGIIAILPLIFDGAGLYSLVEIRSRLGGLSHPTIKAPFTALGLHFNSPICFCSLEPGWALFIPFKLH